MPDYFEFEVTLREIQPRIWRRFLLGSQGTTFWDLHMAIQDSCGWQPYYGHSYPSIDDGGLDDSITGHRGQDE
jgi:hypothetical protein